MTMMEFLQAVTTNRIRSDAFSLNGQGDECYVLGRDEGDWEVFYSERGLKSSPKRFSDEGLALDDLLRRLFSDPTARRSS